MQVKKLGLPGIAAVMLVVGLGCGDGSNQVGPSPRQEAIAICEAKADEEVPNSGLSDAPPKKIVRFRYAYERCMVDQGYPTDTSD